MPVLPQLQPSFNNGEISPLIYDRVDFQKFVSSVKSGKNMFVHPQGGMSNRAGTVMLAAAKDEVVRLIPFEFSSNETYVIEFGNGYCRFFTSEGQVVVEEGGVQVPYEIQSPFTTADLDKIRYCQSGDVMYIAWGGKPKTLNRYGHTNWYFSDYDYSNGPFEIENFYEDRHASVSYVLEDLNYKITTDFDAFSSEDINRLVYIKKSFNAGHLSGTATTNNYVNGNSLCSGTYTFRTSGTWTGTIKIEYSKDLTLWEQSREFSSVNNYNVDFSGSLLEGIWWVRVTANITSGSCVYNFDTQSFEEKCIFKIISYSSPREVRALYEGNIASFYSVFETNGSGDFVDTIPAMTSNTTPSGTVYSTYFGDYAWLMFAGTTTWQKYYQLVRVSTTATFGYQFGNGKAYYIKKISFYMAQAEQGNYWYTESENLSTYFTNFSVYYSLGGGTKIQAVANPVIKQRRINVGGWHDTALVEINFTTPFLADDISFSVTAPSPAYSSHTGTILSNFQATGIEYESGQDVGSYTAAFALGKWHDIDSYPTEVDLYQDRIVWATNNEIDATKISDYKNFGVSSEVNEDDAISVIIKDKKIDKINSIVAGQKLAVYSDDGNFVHNNDTFTPQSATFLKQGATGGSDVKPVVVRDHIIYAHPMKQAISDYAYNFETDGYAGQDITLLANHLFDGKVIKTLAYQQEPYSIIWVLQGEGTVLACTYLRQQNVIAWTPMDFGGKVISIAVCSTGTEEHLYLAVERKNGTFVEKMPTRLLTSDPKECFFVDCGRTYRGEPATVISGLDYLEGQNVVALADGNVVKDLTVENGSVTLQTPASIVTVGLPFESVLETLTFDANTGDGSNLNRKKRVVAVSVKYNASRGSKVSVNGHREVDMLKRQQEAYNTPISLKSGFYREILPSTHNEATNVKIRQTDPLPITIVSIIPEIEYEK